MTDWTDGPLDREMAQRLFALQQVATIPDSSGFASKQGRSTSDLIYLAEWVIGGPDATDDPMERDDGPVVTLGEGEAAGLADIDGESYVRTALAQALVADLRSGGGLSHRAEDAAERADLFIERGLL